jgi:hypothetical protein
LVAEGDAGIEVLGEERDEVFCPGQYENIGLLPVEIARKSLICFAGDGWRGKLPSQPKGTISGA